MATKVFGAWRWTVLVGAVVGVSLTFAALQAQQKGLKPLTTQDILEIQMLGAKYCYGLDTAADNGNYFANVFTVDGSFGATAGREKLAAMAREGGGRLKLRGYTHVVSNFIVDPSPEGAVGSQYIQVITIGGPGKPTMVDHGGRYEDIYVKTPEGWRIKTRKFVRTFPGT